MSHDTKEWYKIWRKNDLLFQKWQEYGEFWSEHLKFTKCPLWWLILCKVYNVWPKRCSEVWSMTLKVDSKLEKKLAYGLENGIMNLANVLQQHSKVLKLGLWWDPFIQSRKYMRLKFTEELFIKTIKNDAKFDEELTCRFEIDTTVWRTLTQTLRCLKNNELKKYRRVMFDGTEDWCKIWRKTDL